MAGIITTAIGLICFIIIPTDPARTRMLNEDERALALARIDADQAVRTYGKKEPTSLKLILRSFNINVQGSPGVRNSLSNTRCFNRQRSACCVTLWPIFHFKD